MMRQVGSPFGVGDAIDAYLAHYNDSEHIAWYAGAGLKDCIDHPSVPKEEHNCTQHGKHRGWFCAARWVAS